VESHDIRFHERAEVSTLGLRLALDSKFKSKVKNFLLIEEAPAFKTTNLDIWARLDLHVLLGLSKSFALTLVSSVKVLEIFFFENLMYMDPHLLNKNLASLKLFFLKSSARIDAIFGGYNTYCLWVGLDNVALTLNQA